MSLQEVIKHQDPKCLLVVNQNGTLRCLVTPIKMVCIQGIGKIPAGSYVFVDGIFVHRSHRMLYLVNAQLLPYYFFSVIVNF